MPLLEDISHLRREASLPCGESATMSISHTIFPERRQVLVTNGDMEASELKASKVPYTTVLG